MTADELLAAGRWAALVPMPVLAGILFVVAYNMSEAHLFTRVLRATTRSDALVLVTTFGLTVFVDLTVAIQVGVVLSAFLFMRRMAEVADVLELTPAYVKGVVTFYTMYHQHPVGRYFIQVCTTTPCHVCGAEGVVDAFLQHTGCGELGVTSADGRFTVIEVECLGACGFATPVMINEEFIESVTPETVTDVLGRLP